MNSPDIFAEGRGSFLTADFVRENSNASFCMKRFAGATSTYISHIASVTRSDCAHPPADYNINRRMIHTYTYAQLSEQCRLCVRSNSKRNPFFAMRHSLRLPLVRNVKHVTAYVDPKPDMPRLFQRFAAQAAPTSYVEDKARLPCLRSSAGVRVHMYMTGWKKRLEDEWRGEKTVGDGAVPQVCIKKRTALQ